MRRSDTVIDYLDLQITIPEGATAQFEGWIEEFLDKHDYVEIKPRLRKTNFQINSTDLIAFMGYLDPKGLNEMDLFRFKGKAKEALEQQLIKSLSLHNRAHYKWCLTALKNLELGRYREDT